jgi:hypothetical protein
MLTTFHVIIALVSLIYSTRLMFAPSMRGIRVSYGMIGLTLASGTYLTVLKPEHLTQTCLTGLVYIAVVSFGLASSHTTLKKASAPVA